MVDFGLRAQPESGVPTIATEAEPTRGARAPGRTVTRRNFIVWYLGGLLTATVVAIVLPILVYIYPPAGKNQKKDLTVGLDIPLNQIQNGQASRFDAPKDTGFVMKTGGGDNAPGKIAFSGYAVKDLTGKLNVFAVNCPHLGCSVQLNADAKRFQCPCHGSQFNLDGGVIHGPAAFPLSLLTWKQGDNPSQIKVQGISIGGIA